MIRLSERFVTSKKSQTAGSKGSNLNYVELIENPDKKEWREILAKQNPPRAILTKNGTLYLILVEGGDYPLHSDILDTMDYAGVLQKDFPRWWDNPDSFEYFVAVEYVPYEEGWRVSESYFIDQDIVAEFMISYYDEYAGALQQNTGADLLLEHAAKYPILLERSIQAIKLFNDFNIYDFDNIQEVFELYYEIEYKYAMINNNNFSGSLQRKENILKILENKGKQVNEVLSDTFLDVYEKWLDNHAITDPKKWAEQRFSYEEMLDNGAAGYINMFYLEWARYSDKFSDLIEKIEEYLLKGALPTTEEILNDLLVTEEGFENMSIREVIELTRGLEELYPFSEFMSFKRFFMEIDEFYLIDALQEWAQYILFPAWYKYWKSQGIDKTRDNIERLYKELQKVNKMPIQKQFGIINQATNAVHQNGSMMDYYFDEYGVDKNDLSRLSEISLNDWDDELREIGVVI